MHSTSRLGRWASLGLATLMTAACGADGPGIHIGPPARSGTFVAGTINLQDRAGESDAGSLARINTIATIFRDAQPAWRMLGVQESRYDHRWTGLANLSPIELVDVQFACGADRRTAAGCLATRLGGVDYTKHANGVLVSDAFQSAPIGWTRLEPDSTPIGAIQRTVIGTRIKLAMVGDAPVLPFYTTHLVPNADGGNNERHGEELRNLIRFVRANWRPGDLPPVVVGDFNCGGWKSGLRQLMNSEFMKVAGGGGVDQVWVGRPQSFPDAGGVITAVAGSEKYHNLKSPGLSDHNGVSVTLHWDLDQRPADTVIPLPPATVGEHCAS